MYQSMLGVLLLSIAQAPAENVAGEETAILTTVTVEQAARNYRIEIYNRLRTNRAEYDRLRKAGDELEALWQSRGEPQAQRADVIGWFELARPSVGTLAGMPLPPLPDVPQTIPVSTPRETNVTETQEPKRRVRFSDIFDDVKVKAIKLGEEDGDAGQAEDDDPFIGLDPTEEATLPKLDRQPVETEEASSSPFVSQEPAKFLDPPTPVDSSPGNPAWPKSKRQSLFEILNDQEKTPADLNFTNPKAEQSDDEKGSSDESDKE